jgi:signal transduction histidine kinase
MSSIRHYFRKFSQTPIFNYRIESTLWLTIMALVILPPFAINNFVQERYLLGFGSFLVVSILLLQAWTIYRGRYTPIITIVGLVPTLIFFLATVFWQQGVIGALWCYPAVIVFYFILPNRYAMLASFCLLVMAIPHAWFLLEPSVAVRVGATLIATTAFSAIFVVIIERQQHELEKKEEQRRDSMASASHELRTPIATLMAQIEAMRDGIRPLNQQQLTSISGSVDHLTGLVEDLYLLSLADVSALTCNREPQRLDKIVLNAVSAAQNKLTDHNISIVSNANTPININGDTKRLRQIIDNLLENCYRYSTPGGKVTVTLEKKNSWAKLTIADTGPGVSKEVLPMLFDRFYRVDRSRSRKEGGTGLGLSLVKALVEVHDGVVKAYHSPEGGLGISVEIPLIKN